MRIDELRAVLLCDPPTDLVGGEHDQAACRECQVPPKQRQDRLADAAAADHQHAPGEFDGFDSIARHGGTLAKWRLARTFAAAAHTVPRGSA